MSGARALRGLAAALVLLALVVGVPLALTVGVGWPLPHAIPTAHQLHDAFTTRTVPPDFVAKVLAVVVWVAWFDVALCVISEIVATARGGLSFRVPLGGAFQPLVGRLVATVALLFTLGGARPALAAPMPLSHVLAQTTPTTALAPTPMVAATRPASTAPAEMARYVVAPGDNLWDIAHAELGDATRWREIYELNVGRPQPDGRWLRRPELIRPGWTLTLPTAANAAPAAAPVVDPAPDVPVAAPVVPAATAAPQTAAEPVTATTLSSPPVTHSRPATPPPVTATRPRVVRRDPARVKLPGGGNVLRAGLLAAGVVAVLDQFRRARQRRRLPGTRLAPLAPDLAGREFALRVGADDDDASFLELALRALAAGLRAEAIEAPEVVGALLDEQQLELLLATPCREAPTGFSVIDNGARWVIRRPDDLATLRDLGAAPTCPMPALVTVGSTATGARLLLDVEETGIIAVEGPTRVGHEVLTAIATELATAHDPRQLSVVLVDFGDHLTGLDNVRRVDSLASVLDELEETAAAFGHRLLERGYASMLDARVSDGAGDWVPTVILCWRPPTGLLASRLASLTTRAEHAGVVALVAGAVDGTPWRFDVTPDGVMVSPLGLLVEPQKLSSRETSAIGELFETALHADDILVAVETEPPHLEWDEPTVNDEADDITDEHMVDDEAGTDEVVDDLIGVDVTGDEDAADDNAAPGPPPLTDIEVRVLGSIEIDGCAIPLTRSKSIELVVHLAMHRRSVIDADRLVEALWPGKPLSGRTLNTTMAVARRALGRAEDGSAQLPMVKPGGYGQYRIGNHVRVDYEQFAALVADARTQDPVTARVTLRDALDLVRGRPFEAVGKGYEWAHVEGLVAGIEAEIADAAHALAQLCLDARDAEGARWAAQQGLRASHGHEQLYRDQMSAADLIGNVAGVESVMKELTHVVEDDDPFDSLHPETVALYKQLTHAAD